MKEKLSDPGWAEFEQSLDDAMNAVISPYPFILKIRDPVPRTKRYPLFLIPEVKEIKVRKKKRFRLIRSILNGFFDLIKLIGILIIQFIMCLF